MAWQPIESMPGWFKNVLEVDRVMESNAYLSIRGANLGRAIEVDEDHQPTQRKTRRHWVVDDGGKGWLVRKGYKLDQNAP